MFACPSCSGELRFDPATQKMKCAHCQGDFDPQEIASQNENKKILATGRQTFEAYRFTCPQCGGELLTDDTTAATFCNYCGSSDLLEGRLTDEKCPDYVIPFKITKLDCMRAYRGLLRRSLFAPKDFRLDTNVERFRGIYMPYWVYGFSTRGPVHTTGTTEYRRGDYVYTDHYDVDFQVSETCEGLSYDASSKFSDSLSGAIAPFDMQDAEDFKPTYLSGFYADMSDVDYNVYEDKGKSLVAKDCSYRAMRKLRTKSSLNREKLEKQLKPKNTQVQMGLFPVWFLANRNADGKSVCYAVVNGQTGKIAADIPMDYKKFLLGTLLFTLPIFVLLNLAFTLSPLMVTTIAGFAAIVAMFLINRQMNRIYNRHTMLDDEGYVKIHGKRELPLSEKEAKRLRKKEQKRLEKSEKTGLQIAILLLGYSFIGMLLFVLRFLDVREQFSDFFAIALFFYILVGFPIVVSRFVRLIKGKPKSMQDISSRKDSVERWSFKRKAFLKPVAALLACILVGLFHPVSDLYYYGIVVACLLLVGWSFLDIMRSHNELTCRPLPQFDKRGGQEYENR